MLFNKILYCTCIIFLKFYDVFKIRLLWLKILQLWCLRDSWVKSDKKSGQLPQSHQSLICGRSNSNKVDVVILSFTFFSSHYTRCSAHFTISLILPPPPLTRSLPNTFSSHQISFSRGLITPTTSPLLLQLPHLVVQGAFDENQKFKLLEIFHLGKNFWENYLLRNYEQNSFFVKKLIFYMHYMR